MDHEDNHIHRVNYSGAIEMNIEARAREVFEELMSHINMVPNEINITRGKNIFSRAEKAYSYGDYEKSISLFSKAKEEIEKKVMEYENIRQHLEDTSQMIESIKKMDGNYRKSERNLKKAKDALVEQDIKRSYYFGERARESAEKEYTPKAPEGIVSKTIDVKENAGGEEKSEENVENIWEWEEDDANNELAPPDEVDISHEENEEWGKIDDDIEPPEIYLPEDNDGPPLPENDVKEEISLDNVEFFPEDESEPTLPPEKIVEVPGPDDWDDMPIPPLPGEEQKEIDMTAEKIVEGHTTEKLIEEMPLKTSPPMKEEDANVPEIGNPLDPPEHLNEKTKLEETLENIRERIERLPATLDMNELNNWLKRTEESIRFQDFNNAWRRMNKSKKLLEEKEIEIDSLKELFRETNELLRKTRELGLKVGNADAAFENTLALFEEGHINKTRDHCKEIISHLNGIVDGHECREIMLELKERIIDMKKQGIDIIQAAEIFNNAGELMKEKNYGMVKELARESQKLARESELKYFIQNNLTYVEDSLKKLKEHDIEPGHIEENIIKVNLFMGENSLEEANELASTLKDGLNEEIEPKLDKRISELNELVKKNEGSIYVKEELEELEITNELRDKGKIVESFIHISSALKNFELTRENCYPLIDFKFADNKLIENVWNRASAIIKNTGKAHAKNINIRLIGPIEIRRLNNIPELNAKESMEMEVAIKFDGGGSVPVDIELSYKSKLDEEVYESRDGLWIEVGTGRVQHQDNARANSASSETAGAIFKPKRATRCKICLGIIKPSSKLYECGCGRNYHATCIERVGECPSCELEVQEQD